MVFSSLTFLYLFLPACILLYFAVKSIAAKNWVLVVFSILFYAWGEPVYVLVLIFSAAVNYFFGRWIGGASSRKKARGLMIASAVFNLALLGYFKYIGFLVENLNHLGLSLQVPKVALPIGISFYAFQTLSYVIDVYRGQVEVQKSYRDFLLYVSLFPQLIAGPIVRYSEIEPQLSERSCKLPSVFYGLTRFCIGLGKKVLIANYAGKVASQMLDGNLESLTTVGGWLGILMFTFQIYFDFSGYSDMAIGLGRVFGFRYAENFDLPYISRSITEFWRRWHISLGSFFRDYVYIPLGGNRKRQVLNLLIVWTLTGLWHGASWNFALWGLYFFVLLYIEKRIPDKLAKIPGILRQAGTFLLVVLGWVLFYCTDLGRLGETFGVLFGVAGAGFSNGQIGIQLLNNLPLLLLCIIGSTQLPRFVGMLFGGLCTDKRRGEHKRRKFYLCVVYAFDLLLLALSTISLVGSSYNPFLYFRF